jgi:hypothetical protein
MPHTGFEAATLPKIAAHQLAFALAIVTLHGFCP